jgi:exosome complex component RRP40
MATLVLPGEVISPDVLPVPSNPSISLKLGPGLRHVPPSTITPTLAGALSVDHKKNAIWVENNSGRVQ